MRRRGNNLRYCPVSHTQHCSAKCGGRWSRTAAQWTQGLKGWLLGITVAVWVRCLGRDSSNTALNTPRKRDVVSHTQHLYRWIFRHVPHTRVDQARPRDTAGQQPRKCRINKRRASSKHEYKCWGQLSIATPGSARRAASRRACRGLGSPMPTKPALTHPHRDAAGSNGASMKSFDLKRRGPKFLRRF